MKNQQRNTYYRSSRLPCDGQFGIPKATPPLFRGFVHKYANHIRIIAIFTLIGFAGSIELNGAQANPLDWSSYQAQTLQNLYKNHTPEKAHQLAEFYGIHDAPEYCRSKKKAQPQKAFDDCVASNQ